METAAATPKVTKTVSQATNRFGSPEPQIEIHLPMGSNQRQVNAALYQLAAELELATPVTERWLVRVDAQCNSSGRVYLELARATAGEAERGMAVMTKLVAVPAI